MELLRLALTFLWLSLLCVGGGLSAIPEMQRQAVARGWVTPQQFVDGYTLSQLTPGPAMLVSMFIGYHAYGLPGGVLAVLAMFLPTSVLTALASLSWRNVRRRPWAMAVERALAPIGIGLMTAGVYTITRSAVHDPRTAAIAIAAGFLLATRLLPPILGILLAGAAGYAIGSVR
ncbi:MAG: chromate transporter [Candidatus Rokubacteria bacterium]|nr:chromate transporter [Candidatus Rokubacteria bacterium]MBI3826930.1 chromate transporter [Candidatus Rokubacteria bacterium]